MRWTFRARLIHGRRYDPLHAQRDVASCSADRAMASFPLVTHRWVTDLP
jgi:hypothetical protein